MEIVQSRTMGYCNGVARVIEMARECLRVAQAKHLPAYSIGWFIHNPTVVDRFVANGMVHIERPTDGPPGVALIRAHGIGDPLRRQFLEAGFQLIDGTCGTVAYSQRMIRSVESDIHVVVAGLRGHGEVVALSNVWNSVGDIVPVSVVEDVTEVEELPGFSDSRVLFMTQTTFPQLHYQLIRERMTACYGERLIIGNRLCPSTARRHEALIEIVPKVDAVVVVGGRASVNTTALVHLVQERKIPVWHVESAEELPGDIYMFNKVGITAGTSTPPEDIAAVIQALEVGV